MHWLLIFAHFMLQSILTFVVFSIRLHLSRFRCGFKNSSGENAVCSLLPAHSTKCSLFIKCSLFLKFYRVFLQKHYRTFVTECQHFGSWSEVLMSQWCVIPPGVTYLPSVQGGRLEDHQRGKVYAREDHLLKIF